MVKNIKALRDKKNGKVTIESLVSDLQDDANSGEVKQLIIIQVDQNDRVYTGWSTNSIEAMGLMQVGISTVYAEMKT